MLSPVGFENTKCFHTVRTRGTGGVPSVEEEAWGQGGQPEIPLGPRSPEVLVVMVPEGDLGITQSSTLLG